MRRDYFLGSVGLLLLCVSVFSGCATSMSRAMYLDEGMTKKQVEQKLGEPKALSKITKPNGEIWETWDYPFNKFNPLDTYDTRVLFVNGKLKEWGKAQDIAIGK